MTTDREALAAAIRQDPSPMLAALAARRLNVGGFDIVHTQVHIHEVGVIDMIRGAK